MLELIERQRNFYSFKDCLLRKAVLGVFLAIYGFGEEIQTRSPRTAP